MRRTPGTKTADIRGSWSRNLHFDMLVPWASPYFRSKSPLPTPKENVIDPRKIMGCLARHFAYMHVVG